MVRFMTDHFRGINRTSEGRESLFVQMDELLRRIESENVIKPFYKEVSPCHSEIIYKWEPEESA